MQSEGQKPVFEHFCVVELMGHQRIAGKVSEQALFGTTLMRVDVPKTSKREGFTKLYGAAAIYCVTPVEEKVAMAMAEAFDERPIEEWRISHLLDSGPEPRSGGSSTDSYTNGPPEDLDDDVQTSLPDEGPSDSFPLDLDEDDEVLPIDTPEYEREVDRAQSIDWAKKLIAGGNFVVLDTETTGLNKMKLDEPAQIAIVAPDGKVLLNTLVNPTVAIDQDAEAIHGISAERVKDAPSYADLHEKITSVTAGKTVVIYNAEFDMDILSNARRAAGIRTDFPFGTTCAMLRYAAFYGDWNDYREDYRWQKLEDACRRLEVWIESAPPHSALGDALRTLAVVQKMADWVQASVRTSSDSGTASATMA